MKIAALCEDGCLDGFACEHGLSLWVEFRGKKVLVDFGQSDVFVQNARKLNLDVDQVDAAFLSHAHYDHGKGLPAFFAWNEHAPVYLQEMAFDTACYRDTSEVKQEKEIQEQADRFGHSGCLENIRKNGCSNTGCLDRMTSKVEPAIEGHVSLAASSVIPDKYIGLDFDALKCWKDRLESASSCMEEGITCLNVSHPGCKEIANQSGLYVRDQSGRFVLDGFEHEQAVVFEEENGLVVICSCSHAGVDHILKKVHERFPDQKVLAFVGGFHLKGLHHALSKEQEEAYIQNFGEALKQEDQTIFYTGHCTGAAAYEILKEILQDRLQPIASGMVFEL